MYGLSDLVLYACGKHLHAHLDSDTRHALRLVCRVARGAVDAPVQGLTLCLDSQAEPISGEALRATPAR